MVKRWFNPAKEHTGWRKDMGIAKRRSRALSAHKGNVLSTARSMQALANVTHRSNPELSRVAQKDARYFYDKYNKGKTK